MIGVKSERERERETSFLSWVIDSVVGGMGEFGIIQLLIHFLEHYGISWFVFLI